MPDNVASSVLVNKPTDEVVVADAYGTPPSEVEKKADYDFTGAFKQAISLATDQVSGKSLDTNKVVGLSKEVGTQLTKEKEVPVKSQETSKRKDKDAPPTAAERKLLNKAAGTTLDPNLMQLAAVNLRGLLDKDATGAEGDGTQSDGTQLTAEDGVVIADVFDASNASTAVGLSASISKLSGTTLASGWKDGNSSLALSLTYLDQAIALGVPQLIDAALAAQANKRLARERMINSVRSVVLRGDINTLDKIIGYCGGEGVLARVPDAVELFVSRYKMPKDGKSLKHHKTRLLTTLTNIDQNWSVVWRNGVPVKDLSVFRQPSPDSKAVLMADQAGFDEYTDSILTAPKYYPTTLKFTASKDFPLLAMRG